MSHRADVETRARATAVLDELWLGSATKPARHLYPHQWSWDSAFIAIGNRHTRWERAALELSTLFAAQWPNGMVPHIVFSATDGRYFPNAEFWNVQSVCRERPPVPTSGICQPPVHATAARLVCESGPADRGRTLASHLYPRLAAWHDHLFRTRAIDSELVEVWHPWETGMDNSPAWDDVLAAIALTPDDVPDYVRVDTEHVDGDDRPSDDEYDRYAFLVSQLRNQGYEPADPRHQPFRVRDVLFNSALARAERDLASLAESIDRDGDRHRRRADALTAAIDAELWDEAAGTYLSQDANTGELIPSAIAGGLTALLNPIADPERLQRLLDTIDRHFLVELTDGGASILTTSATDPGFDANRYWRGPSWININWLIARGLETNGEHGRAERVRRGIVELIASDGFHEYFNPHTGRGHGTTPFAWTAALLVDVSSCVRSDLADELERLAEHDRAVRARLAEAGDLHGGYHPEMRAVHRRNGDRLAQIIDELGRWPGRQLVGDEGSEAAFLIAQHDIANPTLLRRCRELYATAVAESDADPRRLANLDDRISYFEGRPQRYGSHVGWNPDGEFGPWPPLEDPDRVDERRAALGLSPIADHLADAMDGQPPQRPAADVLAEHDNADAFAHEVGWRT